MNNLQICIPAVWYDCILKLASGISPYAQDFLFANFASSCWLKFGKISDFGLAPAYH